MKKLPRLHYILTFGIVILFSLNSCTEQGKLSKNEFNSLKTGFVTPADSNKVWCYWYWLNDDISKEGVTKDLEAMKEAGIGGAFIGNVNPDEINGKVPLFSDQWWEIMVHAVKEGKRLGVDIGVFNCPGWSQSGGPWVKPEMAMRHLVYSETKVAGGAKITVVLPKPKEIFQDVYVIAIPDAEKKFKSISDTKLTFRESGAANTYVTDLNNQVPIKANTILLYPGSVQLKADCELFAMIDGEYKPVKSFTYDRSNNALNVGPDPLGPVAISLPSVETDKFRLVIKNLTVKGPIDLFSEILITEKIFLEKFVEKQLGKMHPTPVPLWGTYLWNTQDNGNSGNQAIGGSDVIDVTQFMDKDGKLNWEAPEGNWIVMRFGMTPTGTKNSPAAPQGKGYEIDKASQKLIEFHFKNYVGELLKRIPAEDRSALKYVIADSYEMGSQNWSDDYPARFKEKYGYDAKKYFPVLSGRIVGSVEESERFLWDLRRSVADDVAHEYVGGLRKISNENHLQTWLENYGHWGFPSEFLMYGGQSNLVSGEFWNEGELGNIECKASSSAAHIYGKPRTSAESFTAAGNSFLRYPALLKRRGDWSFTEGINHVVVHVYIHQPDDSRMPGINAWFSTEFNRHNTWFKQGKVWFDYERRCQHLLQQGKYAADVCYFIGEDAPKMTGARNPELPAGYSYDYINAEVIINRLSVKEGRFVLPDGMSYRLMVLPPLKTMRPEVIEKLAALVKEGGVILGPKPEKSPSLEGYPTCDEQVNKVAEELWGNDTSLKTRQVGKGLVLNHMDLSQAFTFLKITEDFISGGKFPVLWTHRTRPGLDIYFITNQGKEQIKFNPSFRITGTKPQLWDAVTGEMRLLNEFSDDGVRTSVALTMEPGQSWFIVFADKINGVSYGQSNLNFPDKKVLMNIGGPWKLDFVNKKIGPIGPVQMATLVDLSKSEAENIRYYSGTINYSADFELEKIPGDKKVFIDLGDVKVIAHVKINGKDAGGVWMYPWSLEVKNLLKTGKNTVEVEVANLWRNRLILDNRLPEKERYTWTIIKDTKPDETPPSSGLLGPVTIKVEDR